MRVLYTAWPLSHTLTTHITLVRTHHAVHLTILHFIQLQWTPWKSVGIYCIIFILHQFIKFLIVKCTKSIAKYVNNVSSILGRTSAIFASFKKTHSIHSFDVCANTSYAQRMESQIIESASCECVSLTRHLYSWIRALKKKNYVATTTIIIATVSL